MNKQTTFQVSSVPFQSLIISLSAVGFLGCNDHILEKNPPDSSSIPEEVMDLPFGEQLSKTEGVSIIQCRPKSGSLQSISRDDHSASATSAYLEDLIYSWTDFEGWVFIEANFPNRTYDVEIKTQEEATVANLARHAFESTFGLRYSEAIEPIDVWVLSVDEKSQKKLPLSDSQSTNWGTKQTSGGFGYDFRAGSMDDLTGVLGKYLEGGIVIDETGLKGFYKFTLAMDHWNPETAAPAVKALGLKVTRAKRELPTLRINYATED